MSYRRDNNIKVDIWVDTFDPEVDGLLRVRLARTVKPLTIGDVVCLGDGERALFAEVEATKDGVAVLKPSTGADGAPAAPMPVDDGWCDVIDE